MLVLLTTSRTPWTTVPTAAVGVMLTGTGPARRQVGRRGDGTSGEVKPVAGGCRVKGDSGGVGGGGGVALRPESAGPRPAGAPAGTCGRSGHGLGLSRNRAAGDHHRFSAV